MYSTPSPQLSTNLIHKEIQLSLRNSIRHLHLQRVSPAPLIDPTFRNLTTTAGGIIAPSGAGRGELDNQSLSTTALGIEWGAWQDLAKALTTMDQSEPLKQGPAGEGEGEGQGVELETGEIQINS